MKKTETLPTTPGLWWVKYGKQRGRRLVVVFQDKRGLVVEMPNHALWPVTDGSFSNWRKPGRPAAKTGSTATAHIHLRISPKRKRAYQKAAKRQSLAKWMFQICDRASNFVPPKNA